MSDEQVVARLMGEIEDLQEQVESLQLQVAIFQNEGQVQSPEILGKKNKPFNPLIYLNWFIYAALFPLVAGLFRYIYGKIYGFRVFKK